MNWAVNYFPEVKKDVKRLTNTQRKIVKKLIERVSQNPLPVSEGGYGKPLGNKSNVNLTGCYKIKLTAAGIRIVYRLERTEKAGLDTVIISADEIIPSSKLVRNTSSELFTKAVKAAQDNNIHIRVSLSLHQNNYDKLIKILDELHKMNIYEVWCSFALNTGNAYTNHILAPTIPIVEKIWNDLKSYNALEVTFILGRYLTNLILNSDTFMRKELILNRDGYITDSFYIVPEFCCMSYLDLIVITSEPPLPLDSANKHIPL